MNANEKTTLFLPAGQVLSVVAASGASGSATRLAKLPGGGDAQSITAIAGADLSFGPYAQTERFERILHLSQRWSFHGSNGELAAN